MNPNEAAAAVAAPEAAKAIKERTDKRRQNRALGDELLTEWGHCVQSRREGNGLYDKPPGDEAFENTESSSRRNPNSSPRRETMRYLAVETTIKTLADEQAGWLVRKVGKSYKGEEGKLLHAGYAEEAEHTIRSLLNHKYVEERPVATFPFAPLLANLLLCGAHPKAYESVLNQRLDYIRERVGRAGR